MNNNLPPGERIADYFVVVGASIPACIERVARSPETGSESKAVTLPPSPPPEGQAAGDDVQSTLPPLRPRQAPVSGDSPASPHSNHSSSSPSSSPSSSSSSSSSSLSSSSTTTSASSDSSSTTSSYSSYAQDGEEGQAENSSGLSADGQRPEAEGGKPDGGGAMWAERRKGKRKAKHGERREGKKSKKEGKKSKKKHGKNKDSKGKDGDGGSKRRKKRRDIAGRAVGSDSAASGHSRQHRRGTRSRRHRSRRGDTTSGIHAIGAEPPHSRGPSSGKKSRGGGGNNNNNNNTTTTAKSGSKSGAGKQSGGGQDADLVTASASVSESTAKHGGGSGGGGGGGGGGTGGGGSSSPPRDRFKFPAEASVLTRFPAEDNPGSPLPDLLGWFCFPSGFRLHRHQDPPRLSHFVLTGADGARQYCTSLTFYETLPPLPGPLRRDAEAEADRAALEASGVDPNDAAGSAANGGSGLAPSRSVRGRGRRGASNAGGGGGGGGGGHNHEASASFSLCNSLFVPKAIVVMSRWPFYSLFRDFLEQLYRVSASRSEVTLERHVARFLLEFPLPPPGVIGVHFPMGDVILSLRRPPINQLPLTDVPMEHLFKALSLDNILCVFEHLLLEHKVLLRSSRRTLLHTAAESLTALLFPFAWQHTYVPVLPLRLSEFVHAPTPFLFGIQRGPPAASGEFELTVAGGLPPDVVVVDLDNNRVTYGGADAASGFAGLNGSGLGGGGGGYGNGDLSDSSSSGAASGGSADHGHKRIGILARRQARIAKQKKAKEKKERKEKREKERAAAAASAGNLGLPIGVGMEEVPELPPLPDHQRTKLVKALAPHAVVWRAAHPDLEMIDFAFVGRSFGARGPFTRGGRGGHAGGGGGIGAGGGGHGKDKGKSSTATTSLSSMRVQRGLTAVLDPNMIDSQDLENTGGSTGGGRGGKQPQSSSKRDSGGSAAAGDPAGSAAGSAGGTAELSPKHHQSPKQGRSSGGGGGGGGDGAATNAAGATTTTTTTTMSTTTNGAGTAAGSGTAGGKTPKSRGGGGGGHDSSDESDSGNPGGFDAAEVKDAFLRFFVSLLLKYHNFVDFRYPDEKIEAEGYFGAFDTNGFINYAGSKARPFLEPFLQTTHWEHFLERRLRPTLDDDDLAIPFFDECIQAKLNRYTFSGGKLATPFRDDTAFDVSTYYTVPPAAPESATPDGGGGGAPSTMNGARDRLRRHVHEQFPDLDQRRLDAYETSIAEGKVGRFAPDMAHRIDRAAAPYRGALQELPAIMAGSLREEKAKRRRRAYYEGYLEAIARHRGIAAGSGTTATGALISPRSGSGFASGTDDEVSGLAAGMSSRRVSGDIVSGGSGGADYQSGSNYLSPGAPALGSTRPSSPALRDAQQSRVAVAFVTPESSRRAKRSVRRSTIAIGAAVGLRRDVDAALADPTKGSGLPRSNASQQKSPPLPMGRASLGGGGGGPDAPMSAERTPGSLSSRDPDGVRAKILDEKRREENEARTRAAVRIQAVWRGHVARKRKARRLRKRLRAATMMAHASSSGKTSAGDTPAAAAAASAFPTPSIVVTSASSLALSTPATSPQQREREGARDAEGNQAPSHVGAGAAGTPRAIVDDPASDDDGGDGDDGGRADAVRRAGADHDGENESIGIATPLPARGTRSAPLHETFDTTLDASIGTMTPDASTSLVSINNTSRMSRSPGGEAPDEDKLGRSIGGDGGVANAVVDGDGADDDVDVDDDAIVERAEHDAATVIQAAFRSRRLGGDGGRDGGAVAVDGEELKGSPSIADAEQYSTARAALEEQFCTRDMALLTRVVIRIQALRRGVVARRHLVNHLLPDLLRVLLPLALSLWSSQSVPMAERARFLVKHQRPSLAGMADVKAVCERLSAAVPTSGAARVAARALEAEVCGLAQRLAVVVAGTAGVPRAEQENPSLDTSAKPQSSSGKGGTTKNATCPADHWEALAMAWQVDPTGSVTAESLVRSLFTRGQPVPHAVRDAVLVARLLGSDDQLRSASFDGRRWVVDLLAALVDSAAVANADGDDGNGPNAGEHPIAAAYKALLACVDDGATADRGEGAAAEAGQPTLAPAAGAIATTPSTAGENDDGDNDNNNSNIADVGHGDADASASNMLPTTPHSGATADDSTDPVRLRRVVLVQALVRRWLAMRDMRHSIVPAMLSASSSSLFQRWEALHVPLLHRYEFVMRHFASAAPGGGVRSDLAAVAAADAEIERLRGPGAPWVANPADRVRRERKAIVRWLRESQSELPALYAEWHVPAEGRARKVTLVDRMTHVFDAGSVVRAGRVLLPVLRAAAETDPSLALPPNSSHH